MATRKLESSTCTDIPVTERPPPAVAVTPPNNSRCLALMGTRTGRARPGPWRLAALSLPPHEGGIVLMPAEEAHHRLDVGAERRWLEAVRREQRDGATGVERDGVVEVGDRLARGAAERLLDRLDPERGGGQARW